MMDIIVILIVVYVIAQAIKHGPPPDFNGGLDVPK